MLIGYTHIKYNLQCISNRKSYVARQVPNSCVIHLVISIFMVIIKS